VKGVSGVIAQVLLVPGWQSVPFDIPTATADRGRRPHMPRNLELKRMPSSVAPGSVFAKILTQSGKRKKSCIWQPSRIIRSCWESTWWWTKTTMTAERQRFRGKSFSLRCNKQRCWKLQDGHYGPAEFGFILLGKFPLGVVRDCRGSFSEESK